MRMKASTEINYQQRILRVVNYINKHLDDELSLEYLADQACFSAYHFHRVFKQVTGESLKEYIRRRKIQRAVMLLGLCDRSITDIAFDAGFQSVEAFSRHVKKQFGVSPREVRVDSQQALQQMAERHSDKPPIDIEVVDREPTPLAYLLHIGPYEQALKAWQDLAGLVGLTTLASAKTERYGIPYDHPLVTPAEKCHYAACVSWKDEYEHIKPLHRLVLPGGRHIKIIHHGNLTTIDQTYERFTQYVTQQDDFEFAESPSFMRYVNVILNPDKQITEIFFPLLS